MFAFVKALIPGALLSWIVSSIIGRTGSTGGLLHIQRFEFHQWQMGWSWSLFLVGTFLAFALFLMTE